MAKQQTGRHVGKLEFSMQCHILMHMAATCFNIGDVEKMGNCTWKRMLNQTLLTERQRGS